MKVLGSTPASLRQGQEPRFLRSSLPQGPGRGLEEGAPRLGRLQGGIGAGEGELGFPVIEGDEHRPFAYPLPLGDMNGPDIRRYLGPERAVLARFHGAVEAQARSVGARGRLGSGNRQGWGWLGALAGLGGTQGEGAEDQRGKPQKGQGWGRALEPGRDGHSVGSFTWEKRSWAAWRSP